MVKKVLCLVLFTILVGCASEPIVVFSAERTAVSGCTRYTMKCGPNPWNTAITVTTKDRFCIGDTVEFIKKVAIKDTLKSDKQGIKE